jgi:hypothetical protein
LARVGEDEFLIMMCPPPQEGVATVQPYVRLDFQRFDPSFALSLLSTIQCGGSRAITTDLRMLYEDMILVQPTHLGATPAFWNGLYQEFTARVAAELALQQVTRRAKR